MQQPFGQQGMGQQQPFGQQGIGQQGIGQQGMGQQQIPSTRSTSFRSTCSSSSSSSASSSRSSSCFSSSAGSSKQQQGQGQPLIVRSAVEAAALTSGVAEHFWDVVTPLPGQPSILYLYINQGWRPLVNPNQVTHDEVQEAFAFGQQVIGIYDSTSNTLQAVIVNK